MTTTNIRLVFFVLCSIVFVGTPCRAIKLPGPDLPALLRVNSVRTIFFGPNISQTDRRQTLISRGGGVLSLLATGRLPYIAAFRGFGTGEELATLGRALGVARVGTLNDCTCPSSGLGQMEVTWYGRGGRQNVFRVNFEDDALPGAQCPSEVVLLVSAIERFVSDAISHLPQD